ncbi:MAG: AAA family ATPase [Peptococcaceae bacterium]|nr:AAA family ATPase [Peptococcaceae bacterium]MDH7524430.1 AAA family ATPase [Peptococcaceae bacterium]
MFNKRVVRLAVSLVAALAITCLLMVSTSDKQVAYVPVAVATRDIEANAPLTPENLEVRSIPAAAVPEKAFSAIPGGKLAGQKIWKGEYLLPPMVKDHPVTLPEPGNRVFSIPATLQSAGGIQPGDRVDVFLFAADRSNRGGGESKLLLSGITIVGILNQNGQAISGKEGKTQGVCGSAECGSSAGDGSPGQPAERRRQYGGTVFSPVLAAEPAGQRRTYLYCDRGQHSMIINKLSAIRRQKKKSDGSGEKHSAIPRVIAFWSPKATGKTVLAAAVSATLAGAKKRVVCVDFDLLTPDFPHGGYSLDQVASDILRGDFDPAKTASKLSCLKPTGVHLLSGPGDIVRAENLGRVELLSMVSGLAGQFDVVVLDTNRNLAMEATLAALDAADLVVIPVILGDGPVRHIGRYLSILVHDLCFDINKFRLVLNHGREKPALSAGQIEALLGRKIEAEIPYCPHWAEWRGDALQTATGWEDVLLSLVSVPVPVMPGKEATSDGCSELG